VFKSSLAKILITFFKILLIVDFGHFLFLNMFSLLFEFPPKPPRHTCEHFPAHRSKLETCWLQLLDTATDLMAYVSRYSLYLKTFGTKMKSRHEITGLAHSPHIFPFSSMFKVPLCQLYFTVVCLFSARKPSAHIIFPWHCGLLFVVGPEVLTAVIMKCSIF
jgi:hypothetical protein